MLWYGMNGVQLKRIKNDILKKSFTKKYIMEKHCINSEQFELICKWKLKIGYKNINDRLEGIENKMSQLEIRIDALETLNKNIYCDEYGSGKIVKVFSDNDLMLVKFDSRDLSTMCSLKNMTTVHDNIKRKLRF